MWDATVQCHVMASHVDVGALLASGLQLFLLPTPPAGRGDMYLAWGGVCTAT